MKLNSALMLLAVVSAAAAETNQSDWDRVARLVPGTPVEVIHNGLRRSQGNVVVAEPEGISIQTDGGPILIARKDVRRVSALGKSRKNRALLGLAIGAGAGAVALVLWANIGDIDIQRGLVAGAGAAVGGSIGAAVGAATGGPQTIYRAP